MSDIKRRRIVTKVGDIFETVSTKKGTRYLQLIAIDVNDLSSDAVAVYHNKGKMVKSFEEIALLPIEFYSHTTTAQGVGDNLWRKIGNTKVPSLGRFVYKYFRGERELESEANMARYDNRDSPLSPQKVCWDVWTLGDKEKHRVSLEEGLIIPAEHGGVLPASDIIYRIENGKSRFKLGWPTD